MELAHDLEKGKKENKRLNYSVLLKMQALSNK